MFSQLSGWMQYLYVILFMMICGYGVPYLGGFNSGWGEKKRNKVYAERIKRAAFLLDKGANVNTPDVPLVKAMDTPGAFNLLLDNGADVNIKTNNGETVFDMYSTPEVEAVLEAYKKQKFFGK